MIRPTPPAACVPPRRANSAGLLVASAMYRSLALPEAITKLAWPGAWPRASTAVMPATSSLPNSKRFTSLAIGSNTRRVCMKLGFHTSAALLISPSSRQNVHLAGAMISALE
jgi:hypothetical protein